jgi:KDO2-lipid IV(A) lauroyltransferase
VINRSLAPLVPLPFAERVSDRVTALVAALWRSKAEVLRENYAVVLRTTPDDPRVDRMARECFRQFGLYVTEMMHVQGWDTHHVMSRLTVSGAKYFDEAQASDRGVIFVSGHMGSAEIAASIAVLGGSQITSVTEQIGPAWLMDWAIEARRRMGITLLPPEGSGIRLLRSLRQGGMVAFVVDVGVGRYEGVPVEFFGRQTTFPAGPARLARLSGAPIVFGSATREPGGRYHAQIDAPVFSDRTRNAEEDIQALTQQIAWLFEDHVRRRPEQWYAFREIWP